jgi:predicted glycosyltransferase
VRVWIDLANSPHVPLFEAVARRLREDGHDILLTARDHAQTVALAQAVWPTVSVVGGESPPKRLAKVVTLGGRALELRRFVQRERPDVALSHGSYAQVVAARSARVPVVTMMDYEYQPANHLSFRLASRVVVPKVFPDAALRRSGARPPKILRYEGFKEELYLCEFASSESVLDDLQVHRRNVLAVFRPPPEGALYHRMANERFEQLVAQAGRDENVHAIILPRSPAQAVRYTAAGFDIPERAVVDGRSLLALADLVIGAGGTMNREAALLGTPTYTVFAGNLAAVDAELIRLGLLHDLRTTGVVEFAKKKSQLRTTSRARADAIYGVVLEALMTAVPPRRGLPRVRG